MRRRPLALVIYAFILLALAFSFPFQAAYSFDLSVWDFSEWMKNLTWLNLLTAAALVLTSFMALYASRILIYMAPLTLAIVLLNNIWVGYVGLNFSMLQTVLASALFMSVNLILLEPKARAAIRNPQMQWWRAHQRCLVNLPVSVHPWVGESIAALTHDISISGAFIKCKGKINYNVGDRMQLHMSIAGYKDIRCTAKLVRKTEGVGSYPAGFGIQFEDLSKSQKQFLENMVSPALS